MFGKLLETVSGRVTRAKIPFKRPLELDVVTHMHAITALWVAETGG